MGENYLCQEYFAAIILSNNSGCALLSRIIPFNAIPIFNKLVQYMKKVSIFDVNRSLSEQDLNIEPDSVRYQGEECNHGIFLEVSLKYTSFGTIRSFFVEEASTSAIFKQLEATRTTPLYISELESLCPTIDEVDFVSSLILHNLGLSYILMARSTTNLPAAYLSAGMRLFQLSKDIVETKISDIVESLHQEKDNSSEVVENKFDELKFLSLLLVKCSLLAKINHTSIQLSSDEITYASKQEFLTTYQYVVNFLDNPLHFSSNWLHEPSPAA